MNRTFTGLVTDPVYKQHRTGPGHPERPERCDAIVEALAADDVQSRLRAVPARPATDEQLLQCHTKDYLASAKADIACGARTLRTGDTDICSDSLQPALLAAGGVLAAVDAVMAGEIRNAFCVVRPPGHHATASRGMGFCIFNNVAVAVRYTQRTHKLARILIVDWDLHHGNGTQDIFYLDGSVFYFSTHQWPCYPGTGHPGETGKGGGAGTTMNCPFPPGADPADIVDAFQTQLLPAANAFKPHFVFISAGFDSRIDDPLGMFALTDEHFRALTELTLAIAHKHAEDRLVSVIEGGYALDGLASASRAHVRALAGLPV